MQCTLPCPDRRHYLRMFGSLNGSDHDLDGMGHRSIDAQFKELRDFLLPLARGLADFDNHVKTISKAVGMVTCRNCVG